MNRRDWLACAIALGAWCALYLAWLFVQVVGR